MTSHRGKHTFGPMGPCVRWDPRPRLNRAVSPLAGSPESANVPLVPVPIVLNGVTVERSVRKARAAASIVIVRTFRGSIATARSTAARRRPSMWICWHWEPTMSALSPRNRRSTASGLERPSVLVGGPLRERAHGPANVRAARRLEASLASIAFEAVRPDMRSCLGRDELRVDPNLVAGPAHRCERSARQLARPIVFASTAFPL